MKLPVGSLGAKGASFYLAGLAGERVEPLDNAPLN